MDLIEIDVVNAETPQARIDRVPDVFLRSSALVWSVSHRVKDFCGDARNHPRICRSIRYRLLKSVHWPMLRFPSPVLPASLFVCMCVARMGLASASNPPLKLASSIPELASCEQLVTVATKSWDDVNATIRLYQRSMGDGYRWQPHGQPFPAVIGQHGLAWGIGVHGAGEPGQPQKREGDRKAPAGVFRFGAVFGTAAPQQVRFLRLPYKQVTTTTEAIDDPRSKYYNQIVDRSKIPHPDWTSSESMLQVGGRYRLGVVIEHNAQALPGFGSCIFLHIWDPHYSGTTGCTAIRYSDLVHLLHWLDPQKKPLIVQLPMSEYQRLQPRWALP
jgi:D-alanyl-D-alanine dipeptidase